MSQHERRSLVIESNAKRIAELFLRARKRAFWKAPSFREALSEREKRQVETVWGEIWSKPSFAWHEHFKAVNGAFDPLYLPIDVFYLDIMPRLSNLGLAEAWEDKSYYCERFSDAPFPHLIAACIDGRLCNGELEPCSVSDVLRRVRECGSVFVKPSLGSYQGLGAFKLDSTDIKDEEGLSRRLAETGGNFVVQELIEQNDFMSSFNDSSVNIIRMNTVRLDGDPFLANATVRFGVPGKVTDMTYIDGVETVRVVGMGSDGRVRDFYCNQDGKREQLTRLGIYAGGEPLLGFEKAKGLCISMHRRLHHFGIAAFDIAIGRNDEPVVVEVNLGGPGAVFYQYANGPFFGGRTAEVINWCKHRGKRDRPILAY